MAETLIDNLKSELEISDRKRLRLQRRKFLETFEPDELSPWIMLDLMTLILVFFIILYADLLNATPHKKVENNTAAITSAKRPDVYTPQKKVLSRQELKKNILHEKNRDLSKIKTQMHQAMKAIDLSDYDIEVMENRIVLVIGEEISFQVGQAQLLESIKTPLRKIALSINQKYIYRIIVSGHTDNTPIHTTQFPSNWELSAARALSVAKFLIAHDVDPYSLSIQGFGQYNPISDNTDQKGRQANRRVEITLLMEPV
ncbi:MAG: flagellar motor protein MotB [Desulfobacteraceae bacterium]|nr:flagellar motor protein MotB [Desulfobacteraceae bacterium]